MKNVKTVKPVKFRVNLKHARDFSEANDTIWFRRDDLIADGAKKLVLDHERRLGIDGYGNDISARNPTAKRVRHKKNK